MDLDNLWMGCALTIATTLGCAADGAGNGESTQESSGSSSGGSGSEETTGDTTSTSLPGDTSESSSDGAETTESTGAQHCATPGGGQLLWSDAFVAGGNDAGYGIALDTSGGVIAVGRESGQYERAWLRRYDADGCLVSAEDPAIDLPPSDDSHSSAWDVVLDASGSFYVCGEHGFDAWLQKYAPDGTLEWSVVYSEPNGAPAEFRALSIGADGIDVVGRQGWGDDPAHALIARYDSDGEQTWLQNDHAFPWFGGVTSLPDGGAIAYASEGPRVAAFAEDGAPLWTYEHAGPDWESEIVSDAVAWDDHILFVGSNVKLDQLTSSGFIGEIASDGTELAFEVLEDVAAQQVEIDGDGNLVILGATHEVVGGEGTSDLSGDLWLSARTPDRRTLWTATIDDGGDQALLGLALGEGRVAVTGNTTDSDEPPFGDTSAWVGVFVP